MKFKMKNAIRKPNPKMRQKMRSYPEEEMNGETGIACFFDGACYPVNPNGTMGIGCMILIDKETDVPHSQTFPAEEGNTNNVAEYMALSWVLNFLIDNNLNKKRVFIYGDSQLVVSQMMGHWKIKNGFYYEYAMECRELLTQFPDYIIRWIPREENTWADNLSKG